MARACTRHSPFSDEIEFWSLWAASLIVARCAFRVLLHYPEDMDDTLAPTLLVTFAFARFTYLIGDDSNEGALLALRRRLESALVGGLYNTDTNALLNLLRANCFGKTQRFLRGAQRLTYRQMKRSIAAQVRSFEAFHFKSMHNITKHEAIPALEQLAEQGIAYEGAYSTQELYIIVIKDPLRWVQSMCKAPYYVMFGDRAWSQSEQCPRGIHLRNGSASANLWHAHLFDSALELFNVYYQGWLDGHRTVGIATRSRDARLAALANISASEDGSLSRAKLMRFVRRWLSEGEFARSVRAHAQFAAMQRLFEAVRVPHIVVRFEDVLFRPIATVDRVCACVGGYRRRDGTVLDEGASKPHGKSRTRQQALDSYADARLRFEGYSEEDLRFVHGALNHTILDMFGYQFGLEKG